MFNCGEKFTLKNLTVDVEIIGVFPASQTKDRITEYVATLNGEKMKVKESFFEMLKNAEVKEEFVNADTTLPEGHGRTVVRLLKEETKKEVKEIKPKKERKKNGRRK